jgi:hypothetical protein
MTLPRSRRLPHRSLVVAATALAVLAPASQAETPPAAAAKPGRYAMHPADGGFIRLDTETGSVTHCGRADGQWTCQALADDRKTYEAEIDRLTKENAELKSAVRRLEELAGLGEPGKNDKKSESPLPKLQLPTEADVDRAMTYVQRILKKFKEKIREFEDMDKKTTPL